MRLYYFTSALHGLEAIRDQRIKISTIDELNDPFEWLSITGNKSFRTAIQKARTELGSQFGIVCLSDNWRQPLLWAHYANNHSGLCLGFDIKCHRELSQVEYVHERVDWHEIRDQPTNEAAPKLLNLFNTKFDAWSYESEYRMLVKLKNQDSISALYFHSFSPTMTLKQVLVGERSDVKRIQLDRVLGSKSEDIESFKVRAAFKSFEMVRNLRQSSWK